MIRVALRGLGGRKFRATLTALAIVLGVAMVSGTYVLTDTISKAFDTIFTDSYKGTSAVISGRKVVEFTQSGKATVPASLVERVREQPEVAAAAGGIQDFAKLLDKRGKVISTGGAPTLAFGIDTAYPRFNPLTLTDGRWPSGPSEIAIDAGTAEKNGFAVGERIGLAARGPVERFTIVGIARFGSVDSIGGATMAIFDVPTAQRLFDKEGQLDGISVAAKAGVSPERLVRVLRPLLPSSTQVKTAAAQAAEESKETEEGLAFVQYFLLAFGGIALFVGAFVIFNTLSITVAQRAREFATLRTIGASRRQVLGSVLLESLVIGVLASATGLLLGLALAEGLNWIFVRFGLDLPQTGTIFATRTVVVSLLVGVAVTVLAGLFPAVRATRVPPIAAVREGATLPRSRLAPYVPAIALGTIALGTGALLYGMFAGGLGTRQVLLWLAVGCLVLFTGVAMMSARLVQPLASVLAVPATQVGGAAGRLARENSLRNPGRTAVTAAALMIGLALVTLVAVLGEGLRSSVVETIDRQLRADYVISSQTGWEPFPIAAAEAVASAPGVELVSSVRGDAAKTPRSADTFATGIDPKTIRAFLRFDWVDGSDAVLGELGARGAIVTDDFADDERLEVGGTFTATTPDGKKLALEVEGIYRPPALGSFLGDFAVLQATFDSIFPRPRNASVFVDVGGVPDPATAAALRRALGPFPEAKLQTQPEFVDDAKADIGILLNLLYVLLALSVVVSLLGMVNTLVLSVFERTRELGLLRAVGMTRRQMRRMVRHESVITALIGAALGMPLGVLLAALVTRALADEGVLFAVPELSLAVFAAVAVLAGILAAILPARRAARLDVLRALQYE